ncbi:MAG: ATP-dependent DNA helicase RecG [Gammaproteobacteria bacterium]|nr:ATP-dependent DNA helicase RecG [Gammaproteobacteria bacterium]
MEILEKSYKPDNLNNLDYLSNVKKLKGVGQHLANKLAQMNIHTILDLLLHLPYKYQDRTRITNIADLKINNHAVLEGEVVDLKVIFTKTRKRNLIVFLQDQSGIIELRFFHFNNSQIQQFTTKPRLRCFGEVKYGQQALCMMHPEYQITNNNSINNIAENLTPVYPSIDGLTQKRWVQLINLALDYLQDKKYLDYLPTEIIKKYNLMNFMEAVKLIHRPPPDLSIDLLDNKYHPAQQRLIFDELLANQLAMQMLRQQQKKYTAPSLSNTDYCQQLLAILPFELTRAQTRVVQEISTDLIAEHPMYRLVQGDVGSGKTIVAALAMLQAVGSEKQVVLMAPTEILAQQHYHNLKKYFSKLNLNSELLIAKLPASIKTRIKAELAENTLKIIIGTHALLQEGVRFSNLGLVIVDEQHRFGVEQRLALWEKGINQGQAPHQLTMTATPIPRTLAMTIYSDLDYSVIDELPPGRKAIATIVLSNKKKQQVIDRIKIICEQGRQVYWVCTLIEESEALSCQAAEECYKMLLELLPDLKIGLIHGGMKNDVKKQVMDNFKKNELNILVATTVIEVGVDVPNASLIIIENPERLGLSQLHQLRGRVGRGDQESFCLLLYQAPLSETAKARLHILRICQDGFELSEHDLKLRGSGEILGKRQAGVWQLKIADLIKDKDKLKQIKEANNLINLKYNYLVEPMVSLWLGKNYKLASA